MRNILLVISGPSGVGKGTAVNLLLERRTDFVLSVSCTTRAPRNGESEGQSYFFLTRDLFESLIKQDEFLEYDEHFGNLYGTRRKFVEDRLKRKSVLLEIDVMGALQVKKRYPEAVLVMLLPPSMEELEQRLKGRKSESEEQIRARLARAEFELSMKGHFDYLVINDKIEKTENLLTDIIAKEKEHRSKERKV